MPDDGHIVLDVWIAIEKLVSLAKDEDSAAQKTEEGNAENNGKAGMPVCSMAATKGAIR